MTLKRALEVAISMEVADTQSSELRGVSLPASKKEESDGLVGSLRAKPSKKGSAEAKQTTKNLQGTCYRCGCKGHLPQECWHRDKECRKCHRRGHIAAACKSKKVTTPRKPQKETSKAHHVQAPDDSDENESGEELSLFTLGTRMAPSLKPGSQYRR